LPIEFAMVLLDTSHCNQLLHIFVALEGVVIKCLESSDDLRALPYNAETFYKRNQICIVLHNGKHEIVTLRWKGANIIVKLLQT
jgi:hypothetical protein